MTGVVYIFLALVGLFFAGIVAYIVMNWAKWTSKQRKYSVSGMVGLIFIIILVVLASSSTSITFATPSELLAKVEKGDIKLGEQVKIEGEIVKGSVKSTNYNNVTDFQIKDGKAKVKVHYEGVLPDNFRAGIRAVAIGSYNGKIFKATDVKTRCPSKYEAAKPKKEK